MPDRLSYDRYWISDYLEEIEEERLLVENLDVEIRRLRWDISDGAFDNYSDLLRRVSDLRESLQGVEEALTTLLSNAEDAAYQLKHNSNNIEPPSLFL